MTDEEKQRIDLETRLMALEYALVHIGAVAFRKMGIDSSDIRATANAMRKRLLSETFSGADPAMSDHVSAEIGDRASWILTWLADVLEGRSPE